MTQRLDLEMMRRGIVPTRSQAESYIKLGSVTVNGNGATKSGLMVSAGDDITLSVEERYVSRAGLKLASVAGTLNVNFMDKIVLDVGSSTGGFTDFAIRRGAKKVIAVDVGTDQLHPSLRGHALIELHEKTDIRDFKTDAKIDIVVIDVSFISLRDIMPSVARLCSAKTQIVAMAKPQFEAGPEAKHKGVIKNDTMRRNILKSLEIWIQNMFTIVDKADSEVAGAKGNRERFYLLKLSKKRL